jgi:hypothetical protein
MTIGENPGTVEAERTVSMPAEHSAAPSNPPPVTESEAKDYLSRKLSENDDITDFVKERNLQEREGQRGERIDDDDKRGRADRVERLLEKERLLEEQKQLREGRVPGPSEEELAQEREMERQRWRNEGAFEIRARELAKEVPDFHESLTTFREYPLREDIALMVHESEVGADIAYRLARSPEAIAELNDLPPDKAAKFLGQFEQSIRQARQEAKRGQEGPPRRLQTKAPPPIRTPSGGAAPTQSINDLAKRDDLSAYIAARNREDARR